MKLRSRPTIRLLASLSGSVTLKEAAGSTELQGSSSASAQAQAALLRGLQLAGGAVASAQASASLSGGVPASQWRLLTIPVSPSAFWGTAETPYSGNKHISLTWHPLRELVISGGGDYGYGGSSFSYTDGAITNTMGGATFNTFDPVNSRAHSTPYGLRGDHYSLDPLVADPWKLQHPYMPTNVGGSPEDRPTALDMLGFPYDPVEDGFWILQHTIRDDQTAADSPKYTNADGHYNSPGGYPGGDLDEWVNGPSMFEATGTGTKWETSGTYLWRPHANVGPNQRGQYTRMFDDYAWGSWAQPTHNNPVYSPSGSGEVLRVNGGGAGHGYLCKWARHLSTDRFYGVFGQGDQRLMMLVFNPRTLSGGEKRYEWRQFSMTGWQHMICQQAHCDVLGDYLFTPVETGSNAGVRKSSIHWVHLPTALAAGQGGLVPANAWGFIDSPFTFTVSGAWEATGASSAYASNVGLCVVNGRLVIAGGYGNLVVGGVTRVAHTADPFSGQWTFAENFPADPGQLECRAWCPIPKTGEIMLLPTSNSASFQSPANEIWFCKIAEAAGSNALAGAAAAGATAQATLSQPQINLSGAAAAGATASGSLGDGTGTDLELLAATMAPGDWEELVTGNWTAMLQPNEAFYDNNLNGQYGNLAEFADRMIRDDVAKKNYFVGCSRGGADSSAVIAYQCAGTEDLHSGYLCYDEVANTWSRSPESFNVSGGPHAYDHMAIDPVTQDRYRFEGGSSNGVWKYTKSTGQWTEEPRPSIGTGIAPTGSLVWAWDALFYIDGGAGYEPKIWRRPRGSTTWTIWAQHTHPTGYEALFGEYSPQHDCIYFGGGSGAGKYSGGSGGGSSSEIVKTVCKVTSDGTITRLTPNPPGDLKFGITTASGHQTIDPVTGDLLNFSPVAPVGDGHVWSWNGSAWTQHGTHPLETPGSGGIQAIFSVNKDAGVIMAMNWNGGLGSKVWLYKHATPTLTGLDWDGTGSSRRAVKFNSPPAAYPMTVLWKIYQRANTTGGTRYYTTYFWGIDGDFTGSAHKYHGAHPYPDPTNASSTAKWEISTNSGDYRGRGTNNSDPTGASEPYVVNNQWYSQAMVVSSPGANAYNHKFYGLPNDGSANYIEVNLTGISPADPSNSCFVWGQAPMNSAGNASWGGYERYEETNGIIRGKMIFTAALNQTHVNALRTKETDAEVLTYCAANGLTASLWYLNMNPTPTDISDKSGKGNHPTWEGPGRPTLWTN